MNTEVVRLLLVTAIAVTLLAPVGRRIAHRRFDPFEPLTIFALAYGIMFVIRPSSMIIRHHLAFDGPRGALDVSGTFSEMLLLALLGAAAFVLGYEARVGHLLATRLRAFSDLDTCRIVVGAATFAVIGISALIVFLASSSGLSTFRLLLHGSTSQLYDAIAEASFYTWSPFLFLIPSAVILLAYGLQTRSKFLLTGAVGLSAFVLLRTVPLGERTALLALLGSLFVFSYVRRFARPSMITLLALTAAVLVGSAFLSDLRDRATRDETLSDTVMRATKPDRLFSPFTSGPDSEMAPALAAALTVIPSELSHTYGRTIIGDLVSRPVPRAIWDQKPLTPRQELIEHIWPLEKTRATMNPEFSALLYFYWDFGAVGVVSGLLLYGLGARALFEYFLRHRAALPVQIIYSLSIPLLVIGMRGNFVDTIILTIFIVIPALLTFRIAEKGPLPFAAIMSR
jgi:hypothetical protein